ncbi:glycoside hydrolase family 88 protein [Leadbetterella byssophila]|uniref:glycoside hydrolase family 88 protein n=1 Tax=Leadbetterella byssophila TaxID=316068 RepID=UPI0039A18BDE
MKKALLLMLICWGAHAQKNYSVRMADSFMKWNPDSIKVAPNKPARWDYEQGLVLKALEKVWVQTGDARYFNFIKKELDLYVQEDGSIKSYKYEDFNLDNISTGRMLLTLYVQSLPQKEKYKKAADLLWKQLENQPTTSEGGYWHKQRYPYQMWLDGLFMAEPFAVEYATLFKKPEQIDHVIQQFDLIEKYAVDKKSGLIYHAYDEKRQEKWADPQTGLSKHFWGRALGWYAMALVEVLDYLPQGHEGRVKLVSYLKRLAPAIQKHQDPQSGLWYQILDMPKREGNYKEASVSAMFVYALAKGARLGYIEPKYAQVALKGYNGILKEFVKEEADGSLSYHHTVSVGGLGGNPYRDGSYEYYLSEPQRVNDLKGVGPFIFASIEIEALKERAQLKPKTVALDYYFNREFRKDLNGDTEQFHYTWEDRMHSGFWIWGQVFTHLGAKTTALKEAPTAQNLKNAQAYIIVDPDTPKETASPNYINATHVKVISDWVKNGGTLVLMANDTTNCEIPKFNELAKAFGISFTGKNINFIPGGKDYELAAVNIPTGNDVFRNTRKIYAKEIVTLKVEKGAKALVKKGDDVVIATANYGKGRVFVIGDPWLYNEYVDGRIIGPEFENMQALRDLTHWILK